MNRRVIMAMVTLLFFITILKNDFFFYESATTPKRISLDRFKHENHKIA
jgi:hypothetical protein